MQLDDIIQALEDGIADGEEKRVYAAMKYRREQLDFDLFHLLQVGDRVRFTQTCRPQYLRGVEATVVKIRQKKVEVKLDRPVGKFGLNPIITPVGILEAM